MVAQTITLPNIRRIFIPDPGYFICDTDLAQADAQVVAWEADDEVLKEIFRDPDADLHSLNALELFGRSDGIYRRRAKAGVHAVNYDVKPYTLAITLGITRKEAEAFIDTWFTAHPKIYEWRERIEYDLQTKRIITNRFGNRKIFFGRIERALGEALAWIPQSTVALVINRAWLNVENLHDPDIQVLLQVHDNLVYQVKKRTFRLKLPALEEAFKIIVPYDDPLIIPAGLKYSDKSWGDCVESDWQGNLVEN